MTNLSPMPVAYSYVRFSSKKQSLGDSERRQTEMARQWADEHKMTLDESLKPDRGKSAFRGDNIATGNLGLFLTAVRTGKVAAGSYLIVENLDRLTRQHALKALTLFNEIIEAGIIIVTLTDGQVYSKESVLKEPMSLFLTLGTFIRGNQESQMKSSRLRATFEQKRKNLDKKKWDTGYPRWLKLNEDKTAFTVIEEHANTIKRLFAMYDSGMSLSSICAAMTREKVTRPYDGKQTEWFKSTVVGYLRSRSLIGEFSPTRHVTEQAKDKKREDFGKHRVPTGDVYENYYPAIIDRELFFRVNAKMDAQHKVKGRRPENFVNLFRGVMRCPYCGGKMFINGQKNDAGKMVYSYICRNAHQGDKTCLLYSWGAEHFDAMFLEFAENVQEEYAKLNAVSQRQEIPIDGYEHELDDIAARLGKLLPLYETGVIDKTQLTNRVTELNQRKQTLLQLIATAKYVESPTQRTADLDAFTDADLTDTVQRERIADAIGGLFSRIDVYFAGLPSQHKQILQLRAKCLKEGLSPRGANQRILKQLPYKQKRFFIAYTKDGKPYSWPASTFTTSDPLEREINASIWTDEELQEFANILSKQ